MSKASIIGAYNAEFGAFVTRDKATGLMTGTRTYYDLLIAALVGYCGARLWG